MTYALDYLAWRLTLTLARLGVKVKVLFLGQRPRSNMKIVFFSQLSEKEVKGQGHQGQYRRSMSEMEVAEVKIKDKGHGGLMVG